MSVFVQNLKYLARFWICCLFVGVSDFVLIGKDALQSEFLSSVTRSDSNMAAIDRVIRGSATSAMFDESNITEIVLGRMTARAYQTC